MKSCCFAVLFLVIVSCILVADAAPDYRNRKRSSDDSADSIINKIDADLNLEDGDIVERGLDGKRSTDGDIIERGLDGKRSTDGDIIERELDGKRSTDGDIVERGLDGKRNSDDVSVDKINLNLKDSDKTDVERSSEIDESTFTDGDLLRKRAVKNGVNTWPGGVVPYMISYAILQDVIEASNIEAAMKRIEDKTCISFREKNRAEKNYLYFTRGKGCSSPIGMKTDEDNQITLQRGCASEVAVVEHEIMHSLGFWHEQSRPDRDQYVKVNFDNVKKANVHNFKKHDDADTQGLAYDFGSLMHYGNKDFSSNGKQTLESKTDPTKHLGTRKGMTALDIKGINNLYNCVKDKHDTNFDHGSGLWGNYGNMKFRLYSIRPYIAQPGPSKDHTTGSGYFAQMDYKPRVLKSPKALLATKIDSTPEGCRMKFYFYKGLKGSFYVVTQTDKHQYAYKQGSSTVWKQQIHSFEKGTVMVIFYGIPDTNGDIELAIDDVKFENCS